MSTRGSIPILKPIQRWYCPNCHATDVTHETKPHTRFHTCPKMAYLSAPMVAEGVKAKVERRDREDYVGNDTVQTDGEGRPVMSVVTTRDEGQDAVVYAPVATAFARE